MRFNARAWEQLARRIAGRPFLSCSRHALDRMQERGLSVQWVRAVLASGAASPRTHGKNIPCALIRKGDQCVLIGIADTTEGRVITAYHDTGDFDGD